jgi:hypothetical protein
MAVARYTYNMCNIEGVAKFALEAKFDDFGVGLVSHKSTYPIGHRRFAINPNPTAKGGIWPQMDVCNFLSSRSLSFCCRCRA